MFMRKKCPAAVARMLPSEATFAFVGLEEMARGDVGHILFGVVLEGFLAGFGTAQAAQ
jgi:hypothetical protein